MNIVEYYEYAKLAAAAYVNMDAYAAGFTDTQFASEVNKEPAPRVPLAVAKQTFDSGSSEAAGQPVWTIPTGGYYGNDSVGFAATLFQRGTEKVLAIRGTEPDLATGQLSLDLLKADLQVDQTEHTQTLPNGNQLADLGSYLKTDGSSGTLGEVSAELGDINLISNPFYSQFTDRLPLTATAQTLPDMQGSGLVRSLREAASLGTAGSADRGSSDLDTAACVANEQNYWRAA